MNGNMNNINQNNLMQNDSSPNEYMFSDTLYGTNAAGNRALSNQMSTGNMRNMNNMGNMNGMYNYGNITSMSNVDGRSTTPRAISIYSDEMLMPETMTNTAYIPAYLRHQIGRWMRVEFLIGNVIEEKVGQLLDVGASYLILKMLEPSTTMLCDLYSIKFITIIYDAELERLYTR